MLNVEILRDFKINFKYCQKLIIQMKKKKKNLMQDTSTEMNLIKAIKIIIKQEIIQL